MNATPPLLYNRLYRTAPLAVHAPGKPKESPWWETVKRHALAEAPIPGPCESLAVVTWNSGAPESIRKLRGHTLGWFERSLDHRGVPYTVLGQGIGEAWTNRMKLDLTIEFLAARREPFVMGADSSDALLIGDPRAIVERFRQQEAGMLFNAEKQFWPPELKDMRRYEDGVCRKPFRYLNAGLWIGRREACLEAFRRARVWADRLALREESEQVCWKHAYRDLYPAIQIDDHCRIFQNLNRVRREVRVGGERLPSPVTSYIHKRLAALRS